MKCGIIHVSDIHLKEKTFFSFSPIVNAIRTELSGIDILFLAISGDIAFSGTWSQYTYFKRIYSNFINDIKGIKKDIEIHAIMVPGNHDCNFEGSDQVRNLVIDSIKAKGYSVLTDESIYRTATKVQDNFFRFLSENYAEPEMLDSKRLYYRREFPIDGKKLVFHCYNTAWLSKLVEDPGSLFFPIEKIPECCKDDMESNINISLYHHPDNWISPEHDKNNHVEFRSHILRNSEIVLSGHEHTASRIEMHDIDQSSTCINLESNCFHNGTQYGSFSFIKIDEDVQMQVDEYEYDSQYAIFVSKDERKIDLKKGIDSNRNFKLSDAFRKTLEDTEILITHDYIDDIKLSDLYVYPKVMSLNEKDEQYIAAFEIFSDEKLNRVFIFGAEQSGKTALLKMAFSEFYYRDKLPLYIDGAQDITNSNVRQILKNCFSREYRSKKNGFDLFISRPNIDRVILVDNVHVLTKRKDFGSIISSLQSITDKLILVSNEVQSFEDMFIFLEYSKYSMLPFGSAQREQLIQKWLIPYSCSDDEKIEKADQLHSRVNDIIGSNLVPPFPLYIITILQALEASESHKTEITSYGHCYQTLIYLALRRSDVDDDSIEGYYNLLSFLSYKMFIDKRKFFTREYFVAFFSNYTKTYIFSHSIDNVLATLQKARLIHLDSIGNYSFKYLYIFYFFVSKYIAERGDIIQVQELCKSLEKKDNTFILLFLTHHSKSTDIINEIILHTMYVFEEKDPIKLIESDIGFMNNVAEEVTKVVLLNISPEDYRKKEIERREKADIAVSMRKQENEKDSVGNDLNQVDKAFKSIDINGQILKNRAGSLPRGKLIELIEESYLVCFRLLAFIINDLGGSEFKEAIIEKVYDQMKEDSRFQPVRSEIEEAVMSILAHLTYYLSHYIMEKTSLSIGNDKLKELYDLTDEKVQTPASSVLTLLIKSKTLKTLDIDQVKKLKDKFEKNPFALIILKRAVVQYLYMHKVDYKDKQRISEYLGIPIEGQRKIENKQNR